jgi:hypothetical protein
MAIEKRRIPRFNLEIPVAVSVLDENNEVLEILEYTIRDISAVGAYLQNRKMLATGTSMEVAFFLPPEIQAQMKKERAHVRVSGLVVRVDERGIGVCFDEQYHMEPL